MLLLHLNDDVWLTIEIADMPFQSPFTTVHARPEYVGEESVDHNQENEHCKLTHRSTALPGVVLIPGIGHEHTQSNYTTLMVGTFDAKVQSQESCNNEPRQKEQHKTTDADSNTYSSQTC